MAKIKRTRIVSKFLIVGASSVLKVAKVISNKKK